MSFLHSAARAVVDTALGSFAAQQVARRARRGARLILAYHGIVAREFTVGGDTSLHLSRDRFARQLDLLRRADVDIVALDASWPDPGAPPQVAITFDDAYAGALELGLPLLHERGMPATVFVAPALLGADAPWWDQLSTPDAAGVAPTVRESALWEYSGEGARILAAAPAHRWTVSVATPDWRIASEAELAEALRQFPRTTLGTHTWSHPNLAALGAEEIARELTSSWEWLRFRFGARVLPWVAYPYGLESPAVRVAVRKVGLAGGLLVSGGWCWAPTDRAAIPRLNIPSGLSDQGFVARVLGLRR